MLLSSFVSCPFMHAVASTLDVRPQAMIAKALCAQSCARIAYLDVLILFRFCRIDCTFRDLATHL